MLETVTIILAFSIGLACGAVLRRPIYHHNHNYLVVRKVDIDAEDDADWWKQQQ